jgi:type III restriction enzyme
VVKLKDGSYWIIETKGREDINVQCKDEAAKNWCAYASKLTDTHWSYCKVLQKDFENLRPESFAELTVVI